ncbi:MAG TPA: alpha-amylase [Aliicoccus persicus]|uniref:Alpha-amylase n=1 Tax=Aliicoccus persicus TaxID=930138 RepID=A0A921DX96_9STAP|nr:alpha-amylase [Aliicoccus persicus]
MKKKYVVITILVVVFILLLTLPIVDRTSDSERVIVDYTTRDIIHPNCFDQAEGITNNVDEMSLSTARDYHEMEIRDECSVERLPEGKTSLLMKIFE